MFKDTRVIELGKGNYKSFIQRLINQVLVEKSSGFIKTEFLIKNQKSI